MQNWQEGQIVYKVCKRFLVKGRQENRTPLKLMIIDGKRVFA